MTCSWTSYGIDCTRSLEDGDDEECTVKLFAVVERIEGEDKPH
jgi:hypothetical protein